jgi:ketosteroid isomerase-like protein
MIVAGAGSFAQSTGDDADLRAAMNAQVVAWNKGDVAGFMQAYENSPETTFVGNSVNKGYEPILKRYKANYTSAAQMGTLTFSNLQVRLLPGSCGAVEYAVVTGNFHLERTQKGAATKDDGIFSLVWHKGPDGWKIVLDHTS